MSDPIARAFPVRPLRIKAPLHPWRAWLLALMCVVLFGGGMVAVSYKTLPVLLTDYQVRNTAVVLPKTRVERGVCRVRFFLLNDCDATLVVPQDRGQAFRREVNYTFFEPSRARAAGRSSPWAIPRGRSSSPRISGSITSSTASSPSPC